MASATMRARLPLLLLLLGILFLGSICVSYGALRGRDKCLKSCARVNAPKRHHHACHARCKLIQNQVSWPKQEDEEEGKEQEEEQSSRKNPFYFPRSKFQTRYGNKHGRIRVLPRFDRRSDKLENLQDYRLEIIETRPNTLVLPRHADAESLLVVQEGEAIVHLANPSDRDSYNLQRGNALRIPSGTIFNIVNPNDNQNLRIAKLVIPVNRPGKFDDFFPASNEDQQSYLEGFSENTLEAAFNTRFKEIQRVLFEDNEEKEGQQQQQQQQEESDEEEGVIVKLSKEQIQELTRDAKSSSRWGGSSESGPFNLRDHPIYFNKFGRFFEVTPERNPQLQDLDTSLSSVEMKEGALFLPHYNSKAMVVLVANKGKGKLELVAPRDEQQKQRRQQEDEDEEDEEDEHEEEGTKQVRRYTVTLSKGDAFVIPAAYPVAINASSDLHLLGFGINAENNQRHFLAGESDNVLKQMHRLVKEIAFPGSGEEVERLVGNLRESHFASAQPPQQWHEKEGTRGRRAPLTSILGAFY